MFARLLMILDRVRKDDDGASMVEYGLLVALIAIAAIAGVTLVGSNLSLLFSKVATSIGT